MRIAFRTATSTNGAVIPPPSINHYGGFVVVPFLVGGAWIALFVRRRRDLDVLPMLVSGLTLLSVVSAQVYIVATLRGTTSGINAATTYGAEALVVDILAAISLGFAQWLRRHPTKRNLRGVNAMAMLVAVACNAFIVSLAFGNLPQGAVVEGGGWIWYGTAACNAVAGVIAIWFLALYIQRRIHSGALHRAI